METTFNFNLCDSCSNTGCKLQSGIARTARTKCGFYIPPLKKHEEKMTMTDFIYNQTNENYRQMMEYREKTLAEIITKYDFMVGSKELKEKLHEILPKEANIVYSPFIENSTTIFAIKKFDIMDLLQEPYKEDKEEEK